MRHKFLITACHFLHFHLWPFITVKHGKRCARFFGGLELASNFRWRERVIDALATVAKLLDLC